MGLSLVIFPVFLCIITAVIGLPYEHQKITSLPFNKEESGGIAYKWNYMVENQCKQHQYVSSEGEGAPTCFASTDCPTAPELCDHFCKITLAASGGYCRNGEGTCCCNKI
ncbi:uncharacterized protein LOC131594777 [Vicia villosa]|uniref:uncharacterized protein LOC131594777 n=1 Tax=Vicia villosa TaxID=3911 RepID=UPI00273ACB55|nr:uncharacterized protein LOC131594777 [Vicia villosa]